MRSQPVRPLADLGDALGDLFAADGADRASGEALELGHYRVPLRRVQTALASQRACVVVICACRPVILDVLHELVDGLLPAPRWRRTFAAYT
jgi:hypothetical protein